MLKLSCGAGLAEPANGQPKENTANNRAMSLDSLCNAFAGNERRAAATRLTGFEQRHDELTTELKTARTQREEERKAQQRAAAQEKETERRQLQLSREQQERARAEQAAKYEAQRHREQANASMAKKQSKLAKLTATHSASA